MEQFEGIAILATNRKGDLDKAFLRRIRFIVDFFPPGPAERLALRGDYEREARAGWPIATRNITLLPRACGSKTAQRFASTTTDTMAIPTHQLGEY